MDVSVLVEVAEKLISTHYWKIIGASIVAFLMGSFVKRVASILNQIVIIYTDNFGIGSTIYYNKQKAIIRRIGIRKIELYMVENKESKFVHTAEWKKFELILPDLDKSE